MEVKNSTLGITTKVIEKPFVKLGTESSGIDTQDKVIRENPSPENPAPPKKWTILSYVAGDNNLEPHMTKTVDSMELAGSDENTHIVVQLDRGPQSTAYIDGGWKNCRRYYLNHDEEKNKLNSQMLAEFGATNMADPKVLKDFLVWGLKTFPSDYVALILNDHGDGFKGAMHDDSDAPAGARNYLSVPEINNVIAEAEKETGRHVNLVGFNACLMGNVETAYQLKDTTDYMVASEEVELAPGWTIDEHYRAKKMDEISGILGEALKSFQESLKTKIDMTPKELAELIVKTNADHKEAVPTFSAIDMKEMKNVADSIKELGETFKTTEKKEEVRAAFKSAESYGMGWPPYDNVRDLQQTCKNLLKNSSDENVKKAAQKVIDTTSKAIIANEVNEQGDGYYTIGHPESTGLNIYAPTVKTPTYESSYKELAFQQDTDWLGLLGNVQENPPPEER